MKSNQIEITAYILIAAWFALVIIYNAFRYALEKQRMELYLHHLQYQHVQIIEHRLKPIYLEDKMFYNSNHVPKERIKKEIDWMIEKIARQPKFKECFEVQITDGEYFGEKLVVVKACIIPLNQ